MRRVWFLSPKKLLVLAFYAIIFSFQFYVYDEQYFLSNFMYRMSNIFLYPKHPSFMQKQLVTEALNAKMLEDFFLIGKALPLRLGEITGHQARHPNTSPCLESTYSLRIVKEVVLSL